MAARPQSGWPRTGPVLSIAAGALGGMLLMVAVAAPAAMADAAPDHALSRLQAETRDLEAATGSLSEAVRDARMLLAQSGPPAGVSQPALARMDARLSTVEHDLRTLTGKAEQLGFDVRQMRDRLETVISDMEMRLARLEREAGLAASPPAATPAPEPGIAAVPDRAPGDSLPSRGAERPPAGNEAVAALPEGSPQQQYAHAFGLLRAGDYDRAEAALKAFVDRHPDDALSGNARYWLGETHYVRGNYAAAAQAFLNAYQSETNGAKAPDSLLKLGMALARLDKRNEACATFQELERSQPQASPTIRQKAEEEKARIGCS